MAPTPHETCAEERRTRDIAIAVSSAVDTISETLHKLDIKVDALTVAQAVSSALKPITEDRVSKLIDLALDQRATEHKLQQLVSQVLEQKVVEERFRKLVIEILEQKAVETGWVVSKWVWGLIFAGLLSLGGILGGWVAEVFHPSQRPTNTTSPQPKP